MSNSQSFYSDLISTLNSHNKLIQSHTEMIDKLDDRQKETSLLLTKFMELTTEAVKGLRGDHNQLHDVAMKLTRQVYGNEAFEAARKAVEDDLKANSEKILQFSDIVKNTPPKE